MTSSNEVTLSVGTRKGVFLIDSDAGRTKWTVRGPHVKGIDVNHVITDTRSGAVLSTANDPWFGPQVRVSRDNGETWSDTATAPRFAGDPTEVSNENFEKSWFMQQSVMERLWRITPGRDSEPDVLYCGTGPAALFKSEDGGKTWTENEALSNHETKSVWNPGAGGLILHSLVLDPNNKDRMWIAISAAGVYRTDDGGKSWQVRNKNIRDPSAEFDPNIEMYPEAGQCVHHLVMAAGGTDRLYAQGHWGTYRSDNAGDDWVEITEGLPSGFGMTIAAHPHDPDTAWVVPLVSGEFRCPPEAKLTVWRTRDAGKSWQPMRNGLPQDAYMAVYRDAMSRDHNEKAGVYFGTNTGQLYASIDDGDTWNQITPNLPPITSVEVSPR